MSRRRLLLVERERDIAIEEAAVIYHELSRSRMEVQALTREKEAWEAGRDAWSQRHEQILWHVGSMADALWNAMRYDQDANTSMVTVDDARLLALQSFQQLVPKSEAQLYEEMHGLYERIARIESQQAKLMDTIHELQKLDGQLVEERRIPAQNQVPICSRCKEEATDTNATSDASPRLIRCGKSTTTGACAAIHPSTSDLALANNDRTPPQEELSAVALLQAQLGTYINYSKRHRTTRRLASPTEPIEQRESSSLCVQNEHIDKS